MDSFSDSLMEGKTSGTSGAKKNAGQHKMKRMSFKRHNRHQLYRSFYNEYIHMSTAQLMEIERQTILIL
ncbi:hypothetical protein CRUP_026376 [Coryphaenoides rupestris]|nr:hypothetical protein CRUP_026376 [Coryphaenoides rupestris]